MCCINRSILRRLSALLFLLAFTRDAALLDELVDALTDVQTDAPPAEVDAW